MKFIPKHLTSDSHTFYTKKSVDDFKTELQMLFDKKWYDFEINLTGQFISSNEFQITKKISASTTKYGHGSFTKLTCKIFSDKDDTIIDIIVKPSSQFYVLTILPPLFGLFMLYSMILHPTEDLSVGVVILVVLFIFPFAARFYGQAAKEELIKKFATTFKLNKRKLGIKSSL